MVVVRDTLTVETLLVLIALTDGNPEIQKLVAFENAFEILFAIIEQEGSVDGGIVVQDCLQLLGNLLRYNSSNQVLQLKYSLQRTTFEKRVGCSDLRRSSRQEIMPDTGLPNERAIPSSPSQ